MATYTVTLRSLNQVVCQSFGYKAFPTRYRPSSYRAQDAFHLNQGLFGEPVPVALLQNEVNEQRREEGRARHGKHLDGGIHGRRRRERENRDEEQDQERTAEGRQTHHLLPAAEHFFFVPGVQHPKDFHLFLGELGRCLSHHGRK